MVIQRGKITIHIYQRQSAFNTLSLFLEMLVGTASGNSYRATHREEVEELTHHRARGPKSDIGATSSTRISRVNFCDIHTPQLLCFQPKPPVIIDQKKINLTNTL